ncbi:hypothetical protein ACC674_37430, partial [Rhizobium ruizarguesonis]
TTSTRSFGGLTGIALWDITDPTLYVVTVELRTEHGSDRISTRFGFRTAEFTPEGFLLNGKPLNLRGLNRHQAFPYVGYAAKRERGAAADRFGRCGGEHRAVGL